jgi:hypothetical protein
MMKNLDLIPLIAATMMVSATYSFAQNSNPSAGTVEQPAAAPHSSGMGTGPEGKGSTGWTGGARDQNSQTTGQSTSARDAEAAKDQPSMATGEDLKGPPKKFPPNQTPE